MVSILIKHNDPEKQIKIYAYEESLRRINILTMSLKLRHGGIALEHLMLFL